MIFNYNLDGIKYHNVHLEIVLLYLDFENNLS
jgi:hypothetical protein